MNKQTSYIKNITEARAISLFTKKYGDNFWSRWEKVKEEFQELSEVIDEMQTNGRNGIASSEETREHLDDEICDLYATVTHLASIRGLFHKNMLNAVIDKIKTRETNPGYKRFKSEPQIIETVPESKPEKYEKMIVKRIITNGASTIRIIPGEVVYVERTLSQDVVNVRKIDSPNKRIICVQLDKLEPIKEN